MLFVFRAFRSRTLSRAAAAMAVAVLAIAGPVSAATSAPGSGKTVVAQATESATITGRIGGSAVSAGIAGATVIFAGPSRVTTTTDDAGNFSISVSPGIYTVTVNKGGYQTGSTEITVVAGVSQTVNVQLTESSLSNLQVIGRTTGSNGSNAARF